mmetsp:Transcript_39343/g.116610  ORF Transcript_39343/g.116610 Transcript_39343/m.116610 type:complete len:330 (+) Transcript_39343:1516-2505(+)
MVVLGVLVGAQPPASLQERGPLLRVVLPEGHRYALAHRVAGHRVPLVDPARVLLELQPQASLRVPHLNHRREDLVRLEDRAGREGTVNRGAQQLRRLAVGGDVPPLLGLQWDADGRAARLEALGHPAGVAQLHEADAVGARHHVLGLEDRAGRELVAVAHGMGLERGPKSHGERPWLAGIGVGAEVWRREPHEEPGPGRRLVAARGQVRRHEQGGEHRRGHGGRRREGRGGAGRRGPREGRGGPRGPGRGGRRAHRHRGLGRRLLLLRGRLGVLGGHLARGGQAGDAPHLREDGVRQGRGVSSDALLGRVDISAVRRDRDQGGQAPPLA